MEIKKLYHKDKLGNLRIWKVWTEGNEIFVRHGLLKGKKQTAVIPCKGKNIGKKNETSPAEQAEKEAQALYEFKLQRKYSKTKKKAGDPLIFPQLASQKKFKDYKKSLKFPIDVQEKLNGLRCLSFWNNGELVLLTRGGKEYWLPHIRELLERILPENKVLDGEIFKKGWSLQTIVSAARSLKEETFELEYHCYDIVDFPKDDEDGGLEWEKRKWHLKEFFLKNKEVMNTGPFKLVNTNRVNSVDEILSMAIEVWNEGGEGLILREHKAPYQFGVRNEGLKRVKNYEDAEFKIVDFTSGKKGKGEKKVIWICNQEDGKPFKVSHNCTEEESLNYLQNGKKYIGKIVKVSFLGRTDDNIPSHAKVICFRDEKDMPLKKDR